MAIEQDYVDLFAPSSTIRRRRQFIGSILMQALHWVTSNSQNGAALTRGSPLHWQAQGASFLVSIVVTRPIKGPQVGPSGLREAPKVWAKALGSVGTVYVRVPTGEIQIK
jgi:hypothetical protein